MQACDKHENVVETKHWERRPTFRNFTILTTHPDQKQDRLSAQVDPDEVPRQSTTKDPTWMSSQHDEYSYVCLKLRDVVSDEGSGIAVSM